MNCKNCGDTIEGKYCSQCGQLSSTGRLTSASLVDELSESIFQVNRGFFFTAKELSVRPGNTIVEYLDGKRKPHFKPIAYVLALSTIYFLITQVAAQNTWVGDVVSGWMEGVSDPDAEIPTVARWIINNYAYTTLLLLPVFSLASYLSFFKAQKNYIEHIVINCYITGHQAIFYALFAILHALVEKDIMEVLPLPLAVAYAFWVFGQAFSSSGWLINILRTLLAYLLYLVFCTILLGVLAGIS